MEIDGLKYFKIGELADLVEMSPRTIRYYEEIGLLNSVKRIEGGKRVYTDKDFQRLKFIGRLKHLGLTLSEMHELEDIYQIHRTNRKVLSRLLELLDNHAGKIDERINNLIRLKADILNYQKKIRQKLNAESDLQKGGETDERSDDHQRHPNSHR
ncbi:MAG: MerR family transcriptional regulator [Thermodesulfobacteriota bacterium]